MESLIVLLLLAATLYLFTGALGLCSVAAAGFVWGLRALSQAAGLLLPDWMWFALMGTAVLSVVLGFTRFAFGSKS